MIHRGVDEVDAAQQIVRVIEMLDEMAQALRCVGCEMKHMFKMAFSEQSVHQSRVGD